MKQRKADWEKEFDLLFGEAPVGTLKYLKHKSIKDFISRLLARRVRRGPPGAGRE